MLKQAIAICLVAVLLSSGFSRFFVYAGFELNQKYIAQNFCINKNKPWLHCNGHCYFMRKIKEAQENEKKQERADRQNHYQEALPIVFLATKTVLTETRSKTTYPDIFTPATIQRSYSILLPPKVA
jgi:hypothetical protein